VKTLTTIQNKGLRKVLGAYKATPIPVLEAEAGIPSVRDFLDKALLRSKILRGTHETVLKGNAKIKSRLQPKRGRRLRPPLPPSAEKESWAKRSLNGVLDSPTLQKRMLTWWEGRQQGRWRHYQRGLEGRNTSPAQKGDLVGGRWDLHKGLKKPESSAAVQLRTDKIGFNYFLFIRKVPGILSPSCPCGAARQTGKHVLLFCPDYHTGRSQMLLEAGSEDYSTILSSPIGIRAAARWLTRSGALHQFMLAKEMLARTDREEGLRPN